MLARAGEVQTRQALSEEVHEDPPAMPVSVRVLRSASEVEEVRDSWMQMQRHPNSDIDFYLTVLRSTPRIPRPYVLVLYRDATARAILVGRVENSRVDLRIGYAGFLAPQSRVMTFIYGGLLGNPCSDECEVLVQEVMKSLRQGEAEVAFFNHLRADSPLYASLACLPGFLSRDHFPTLQTHRRMTVPPSVGEFWGRLSPKVRKNQRWQAKKFLNDHAGKVRIDCFRETSSLDRMAQDVELVAKKTYQRGLGVGFSDSAETRKRLYLKAEKGWLRTYVLYVADRPWAFWSGTLYKAEFHSDFMGYDPEHGKYSPGMYLITQVIEGFCKQDGGKEVAAIDFGLGDAQYKEVLGDSKWQDVSAYIFAPTIRGVRLNAIRTPIILVDRVGRRALGARLLARVKKLWRNRVAQKWHPESAVGAIGQPTPREEHEPVTAE